jgi:hypothetical protein
MTKFFKKTRNTFLNAGLDAIMAAGSGAAGAAAFDEKGYVRAEAAGIAALGAALAIILVGMYKNIRQECESPSEHRARIAKEAIYSKTNYLAIAPIYIVKQLVTTMIGYAILMNAEDSTMSFDKVVRSITVGSCTTLYYPFIVAVLGKKWFKVDERESIHPQSHQQNDPPQDSAVRVGVNIEEQKQELPERRARDVCILSDVAVSIVNAEPNLPQQSPLVPQSKFAWFENSGSVGVTRGNTDQPSAPGGPIIR